MIGCKVIDFFLFLKENLSFGKPKQKHYKSQVSLHSHPTPKETVRRLNVETVVNRKKKEDKTMTIFFALLACQLFLVTLSLHPLKSCMVIWKQNDVFLHLMPVKYLFQILSILDVCKHFLLVILSRLFDPFISRLESVTNDVSFLKQTFHSNIIINS